MGSPALKIKVIGISGKYCSGKSMITRFFREWGFTCIDVDKIGHILLDREQSSIVESFGPTILNPDTGKIDRRVLGKMVFADDQMLARLEGMLHPGMVEEIQSIIRSATRYPVILDAALLFRMQLHVICQKILWVQAPAFIRFLRAARRDGWRIRRVLHIFRRQEHFMPKIEKSDADTVIVDNTHSKKKLQQHIHYLIKDQWQL